LYSDGADHVSDFTEKGPWLIDHPEERARMGEFCRKRIEQELGWEYSVQNLLAAYQRVFTKVRGMRIQEAQGSNAVIASRPIEQVVRAESHEHVK